MEPKNLLTEVFNRRQLLLKSSGVAVLAALHARGWGRAAAQTPVSIVATPSETEGPYFVDEKLNRSDIRVDPTTSIISAGFPLALGVTVSRISNGAISPLTGAYVDIWHCDAGGLYSDEQANGTTGKKYLRGYQVTDAHGNARFLTVYPGWYSGRTVHIHAKVRLYTGTTKTYEFNTQFFFDETITSSVFATSPYNQRPNRDTTNAADGIYSNGGTQLMLRLAKDQSYATSSFHIALNA